MNKSAYCHRCKKTVNLIKKMWCYICAECRVILKDIEPNKPDTAKDAK